MHPSRHLLCSVMDPSDHVGNLNHNMQAMGLKDGSAPEGSTRQRNTSPVDMLRFVILLSHSGLTHISSSCIMQPRSHLCFCNNTMTKSL